MLFFYYYLHKRPGSYSPTNKRMEDDDQDPSLESGVGGGASRHGTSDVPRLANVPSSGKSVRALAEQYRSEQVSMIYFGTLMEEIQMRLPCFFS